MVAYALGKLIPGAEMWLFTLAMLVGLVPIARRAVMAAARTLFVSTGVLLAGRRSDSTITMTGGHDWMSVREDVAAGESSMAELLHERRLVLRTELLRPMARWVTAEFVHRRFDLRCFLVILPVLAIAGSLAAKKTLPESAGTFPTHGPLFVALLVGTVLIVGGLTFFPALSLGPIAEHLMTGVVP